ncbi:MAG: hypothetical protein A3F67_03225 [Verrucomicrobia bacterium RIFCSPHIGHO2_12_FULL_41_10]|nr:MAG: hypothetical protein A3F67_03225 [Verrucomicrobia bacterium RIFCSPHIGHO2_12_FULL_41_10]HLB33617.1 type II toxin-antitoxin system ParD family antitoxin [Chthoniobacterales bacterium]
MNVTLTEKLDKFVTRQLAEGNYCCSDEIVIESLQLLEERESKLKKVQSLLLEGKNSALLSGKEAMKNIRKKLLEKHGV